MNTTKLIWNVDLRRLRNFFPLIATLFYSSLVKKVFYSENIHFGYNFYGTDRYVSVCRGVFGTQWNIWGGVFLWKLQKSFIVDVWMGSKHASGITFKVEKV